MIGASVRRLQVQIGGGIRDFPQGEAADQAIKCLESGDSDTAIGLLVGPLYRADSSSARTSEPLQNRLAVHHRQLLLEIPLIFSSADGFGND